MLYFKRFPNLLIVSFIVSVVYLTNDGVLGLTCYKCNSTLNIRTCSDLITPDTHFCGDGEGVCVTGIYDGYIFRDCLESVNESYILPSNHITCDEDKCNNQKLEQIKCIVCNSTDDYMCATDAGWTTPDICKNEVFSCHTCFDRDGVIYRGCGNDTNTDFSCEYCNENECNNKPMKTCYSCNSSADPNCAQWSSPNSITIKVCSDGSDMCAKKLDHGYTIRGCKTEIGDCTEEYCETCEDNNCNGDIYPAGRLQCYQCSGEYCVNDPDPRELKACALYKNDDQCFTDIIRRGEGVRGCLSDPINCQTKYCQKCNGTECNKQNGLKHYECFTCNSNIIPECKSIEVEGTCVINVTTKCSQPILLGREEDDTCFTKVENNTVQRGCIDHLVGTENTERCSGALCNLKCVQSIKCYSCNSDDEPNCVFGVDQLVPRECSLTTNTCYACTDRDGVIYRGCGEAPSGLECSTCDGGNGCNSKTEILTKCYSCNSQTDPNCAQWTNPEKIRVVDFVTNGSVKCITKIRKGHTLRGLSDDTMVNDCQGLNEICASCLTNYCNARIYPRDRLLCHQCEDSLGEQSCAQLSGNHEPLACVKYRSEDRCVTVIDNTGNTSRGCFSDAKVEKTCGDNIERCRLCSTNGCNRITTNLSCIRCQDNEECPWGFDETTAVECDLNQQHIDYYCFTYENLNGVITRGCSNDRNKCYEVEEECNICTTNGCNNLNQIYQYCIQCNSSLPKEQNCTAYPETFIPTRCTKKIQPYELRGCYAIHEGNFTVRGCISDLSESNLDICQQKDNSIGCHICLEQKCNIEPYSDGATNIFDNNQNFSVILIVFMSFVLHVI